MDILEQLSADLDEFEEEFGDFANLHRFEELGLGELAEELEAAGLEELVFGEEDISIGSLVGEGDEASTDVAFIAGWLKPKVKRLLRKLISLLRKFGWLRKCRPCVRITIKAIQAYGQHRYITALRYAYKAYRCFRRCIIKKLHLRVHRIEVLRR